MGEGKPYSDIVLAKISGEFSDYPNTDWWNTLIKNGSFSQRHTLTLDGGSEDTQYRMSFMYMIKALCKNMLPGRIRR